jgi:hypothetical protein
MLSTEHKQAILEKINTPEWRQAGSSLKNILDKDYDIHVFADELYKVFADGWDKGYHNNQYIERIMIGVIAHEWRHLIEQQL